MKNILIVIAAIIIPIVALYLIFAFIAWNFWWPSDCEMSYRIIYIIVLALALFGSGALQAE